MAETTTQDDVNRILWQACDTFRGLIDAADYKDFVLTMLFVKYISDVWKERREEYVKQFNGDKERISRKLERERFVLPEKASFEEIFAQREGASVGETINKALEAIELANKAKLKDVFRNVDFNSEARLGTTKKRNGVLKNLLEDFHKLDLRPSRLSGNDVIGDSYEFLIGKFADDAGKKAGEFYTPKEVSILLAKLLAPKAGERICDPACGSGSLLLRCAREANSPNVAIFGQENNRTTWALCMMNMFLHDVANARIEAGDTLLEPQLIANDQLMRFDVVAANPPFSLDKWGADKAEEEAKRFNRWHRGVPPKSKGDYAFISHMVETTVKDTGRVGVVVPHGVLFRGGAEGAIRQKLIEENLLDAVIGLPSNLFFGTTIPAAILILRRDRGDRSDVMFIDASREFQDGNNQNKLRVDVEVSKIVKTYQERLSVDKYAYLAKREEVAKNEFNLNIPRYVDTNEADEVVDISNVSAKIAILEAELAGVRSEMAVCLKELGL